MTDHEHIVAKVATEIVIEEPSISWKRAQELAEIIIKRIKDE